MSQDVGPILSARFKQYKEIAEARLTELGFAQNGRSWEVDNWDGLPKNLSLRVEVPDDFPVSLPRILLDQSQLPRRIPHVESSGKICFIADSNLLVNSAEGSQIIDECLSKAVKVIADGLAGKIDADFITELSAYWNRDTTGKLIVVGDLDLNSRARKLSLLTVEQSQNRMFNKEALLVAENDELGNHWLKKIGADSSRTNRRASAYFLPLSTCIELPTEIGPITYDWLKKEIESRVTGDTLRDYAAWEQDIDIKVRAVVLCFPGTTASDKVCCSFSLDDPARTVREKVLSNCPPHKLKSTAANLAKTYKLSISPLEVLRFDPEFLIERGGGVLKAHDKSVAVIGCGAVGSHIAERLAMLGVGRLVLFDPDKLAPENIHRHVLGASDVGKAKVEALKNALNTRFPHISIATVQKNIQKAVQETPNTLDSFDLLVFATGEETLEREMTQILATRKPSIHAWLEAYGVGYHVLCRGDISSPGCFNCLYCETEPLSNKASFFEPGQNFKRNMAGCSGSFTPFSALVVSQVANEVAEQVIEMLTGNRLNQLVSTFLSPDTATKNGFKLSPRVKMFASRERKIVTDL